MIEVSEQDFKRFHELWPGLHSVLSVGKMLAGVQYYKSPEDLCCVACSTVVRSNGKRTYALNTDALLADL